jgi:hypothetical protein
MIAWRSTPRSAQERCARRALVNSLDGSVDTLAAADRGLGGSLPPFHMPRWLATGAHGAHNGRCGTGIWGIPVYFAWAGATLL